MRKPLLTIIATIALFLGATFAQSGAGGESPQEGLRAVMELYKARDWNALLRERCADAPYATSLQALRASMDRLESAYADPERHRQIISSMESALRTPPRFSDDGAIAIFSVSGENLSLTKMDTGQWGIRL